MGFFDGLIEGNFKSAADGQRLFYPRSVWGKGYVLPDTRTEQRIRRFLKVYYMVSLLVLLPLVVIIMVPLVEIFGLGLYYALALIVIPVCMLAMLVHGVGIRSLTRSLPATPERLRWSESLANSGRAHSGAMLWFLFIVSILFVIDGIWMIFDRQEVGMGVFTILIFGACGTMIGYMLRTRSS